MSAPQFLGDDHYNAMMAQYKKMLEDGIIQRIDVDYNRYGLTEVTVKLLMPLKPRFDIPEIDQDTDEDAYDRAMGVVK